MNMSESQNAEKGGSNRFDQLESNIEQFIENCRQIGIMVSDFQPGCQSNLNTKLNDIVTSMQEVDKLKGSVADVTVPPEIFQYIDEGRNPQLYTKDCLQKVRQKKDDVECKIDAYKNFKGILEDKLKKELPQTMEKHHQFKRQQHK